MKKLTVMLLVLLLVSVFTTGVYADGLETGSAALELLDGGLNLINPDDAAAMAEIDPIFAAIGSMSVDFGDHYITGNDETYESLGENDEQIYVGAIVQDARGLGAASLWDVSVKLGNFYEKQDDQTATLSGSVLTLTAVEGSILPGTAPLGTSEALAETVTLAPGAANGRELFRSASKQNNGSAGVWGANWIPTLWVPASAELGEHSATLTWTLTAGF